MKHLTFSFFEFDWKTDCTYTSFLLRIINQSIQYLLNGLPLISSHFNSVNFVLSSGGGLNQQLT